MTERMESCKHKGECTTNPEKVRAEQEQLDFTDTGAADP